MLYTFDGQWFPDYLKGGNASQFIAPAALHFCKGKGLDVGAGQWPLPGATPIDAKSGGDALKLPAGPFDYIFSSHMLEHHPNPIQCLEHWKSRLRPGGVLFLYLPNAEAMPYWRPQHCRKHLHQWRPHDMVRVLEDLGFTRVVLLSERDAYYSFAVVGFVEAKPDAPFQWLVNESADHIHSDPVMSEIFKRFGADAFRRSSAVEAPFWGLITSGSFKGKRCVEIGTYNGMTAIALARCFDEVVTFDVFSQTAKRTIAEMVGVKNVRFVDVPDDNVEKYRQIGALTFDAAYVDGNHERDTESDFEAVRKCGRVLFHEYWDQQPPVFNLVNRLRKEGWNVQVQGKFALCIKG